jgi:hypothetical protein
MERVENVKFDDGLYSGFIKEGQRHGQGTLTKPQQDEALGDSYSGEWKDDKKCGQGTEKLYVEGEKTFEYIGEWKDDKKCGQGTEIMYLYLEGEKSREYIGKWKNDNKCGQGTKIKYFDGEKDTEYTGEWKDGNECGQGTKIRYKDGKKDTEYIGEWKDGNKCEENKHSSYLDDDNYDNEYSDYRKKYEAKYRTSDGHYVRSRGEVMIANWLYMNSIRYEYEKRLPIPDNALTDFYLIDTDTYIEYWGLDDVEYLQRKNKKIELYNQYGLKLLSVTNEDLYDLDRSLLNRLMKKD